jgi:hypothetical protein
MPSSAHKILADQKRDPFHMTIWMIYSPEIIQYHCFFCEFHKGLWRTHQRAIAAMVGEGMDAPFLTPPVSIECPKCGAVYHLSGFSG